MQSRRPTDAQYVAAAQEMMDNFKVERAADVELGAKRYCLIDATLKHIANRNPRLDMSDLQTAVGTQKALFVKNLIAVDSYAKNIFNNKSA